jgi:hypothetical protein
MTNPQFLLYLFTCADATDDPLAYLEGCASAHVAAMVGPNSSNFARACTEQADVWIDLYGGWHEDGCPVPVREQLSKHYWEDHE